MKFDKNQYNRLHAIRVYDWGEEWLKNEDEPELAIEDDDEMPSDDIYDYTRPYLEKVRT